MVFSGIIGNDSAKEFLKNQVDTAGVLHSYMFVGKSGIGKKMVAREFAKMVLCQEYNNGECGKCKSCIEFDSGNNPDYFIIEPEGKSIKIEQIRQAQNKMFEMPVNMGKKVYIIDDADLMTIEAQNCLLKTLEEPPHYAVIILIVENEEKILPTIKSRCMKLLFSKISDEDIRQYLENNCGLSDINENIIKFCDGSISRCLNLKNGISDYNKIEEIMANMNKSITTVLNVSDVLYKSKDNILDFLEYLNVILYRHSVTNSSECLKYINSIEIVEETKKRLASSCNYDMCVDYLLFNIWRELNEKNSGC